MANTPTKVQAFIDKKEDDQGGTSVTVTTGYAVSGDNITLWGIGFTNEDGVYQAQVTEEEAKSLIDAGRAVLSK